MYVESLSWLSWDFSLELHSTEQVFRSRFKRTLWFSLEMKNGSIKIAPLGSRYTHEQQTFLMEVIVYSLTLKQFGF